ncbi:NHL repeat-containing protein [Rhodopirellula islandica]|nr:lipoprotein [Rhodopirellula islandica]
MRLVVIAAALSGTCLHSHSATAQDAADSQATPATAESKAVTYPDDFWTEAESPVYPRGAVISENALFVVDSDAPGVWTVPWPADKAANPERYVTGSRYLRKTMNRPFCATPHPEGGVLVGDAATREIYHITPNADAPGGQDAKPLNGGFLGIPMALAVSPDGKTIYVGDAERRATFALPIEGGEPELVVRVNARGLIFDDEGALYAVTPDADAVVKINVGEKTSEPVVTDRPYGFPGGIAWHDGTGFVSDVYGKCIWQFTADGKTEKWFDEELLRGPVGLSATADAVIVSDPKAKQVYRIDRESKEVTKLFAE